MHLAISLNSYLQYVDLAAGLYYINMYGHEIQPSPNPDFLSQCAAKDILVYSCGSLWTRLAPVSVACPYICIKLIYNTIRVASCRASH